VASSSQKLLGSSCVLPREGLLSHNLGHHLHSAKPPLFRGAGPMHCATTRVLIICHIASTQADHQFLLLSRPNDAALAVEKLLLTATQLTQ
jgi:hypothetical protein